MNILILDKNNFNIILKKMIHWPLLQIFSCIFAFFGFSFFYCTEAKAQTHSYFPDGNQYSSQKGLENIQLKTAGHHNAKYNFNKWIPWVFAASLAFQLSLIAYFQFYMPKTFFRVVGAKEFYIRTGLSPPILFS